MQEFEKRSLLEHALSQQWPHCVRARMACSPRATSDDSETMTYMMWPEEHLWSVGVL